MGRPFNLINTTLQGAKLSWTAQDIIDETNAEHRLEVEQGFAVLETALHNLTISNEDYDTKNSLLQAGKDQLQAQNNALKTQIASLNGHISTLYNKPLKQCQTNTSPNPVSRTQT